MKPISLLVISILFFVGGLNAQTIRIAYENNFGPYSYENDSGQAEGVLIDIYELWAKKAGYAVEFVPCIGAGCLELVSDNSVDILAGTLKQEVNEGLTMVTPILRLSLSLFIRNDLLPESIISFKDTVTIIKGSPAGEMMNTEYSGIKTTTVNSFIELEEIIENKTPRAFVFEMPDPVIDGLKMKVPNGYTRFHHLSTKEFRPVIQSENNDLIIELFKASEEITRAELIDIASKHKLYITRKADYTTYILVVSLLVILIIFLLFRNRYLKKTRSTLSIEVRDWESIIAEGEHDKVEFKSSFRWDYRQEKPNKALEFVIMKTIAAFLNAEGGVLIIGVNDEGKILGLKNDYNSLKKANRDGFMLALTNLINQSIGKDIHRLIKIVIAEINGEDVCSITVLPSEKPVFLGPKGSEEFFVRASASSQPLSMSEALAYIKEHWPES